MVRSTFGAGCVAAVIAACGTEPEARARSEPVPPPPPVPALPPATTNHVVEEGETLWDIARAYDTHVDAILDLNDLSPADAPRIRPGRSLKIPGDRLHARVLTAEDRRAAREEERARLPALTDGAYHFLAEGETLWDLARLYDRTADAILARNQFSDEDVRRLRPGQAVIIPGIRPREVRATEAAPRSGVSHVLVQGETVWDLARDFHVAVAELMAANRLTPDEATALRAGEELWIPGVTRDRTGQVQRRTSAGQDRATAIARRLGLGSRNAAGQLLHGRVKNAWLRAAGDATRLPGTLRWPVTNGWYVRGFGSGQGGYHLAMDIMGKMGWNVRAAAPGIVGYSGNELHGFGNIVMVVHPGGWVTLYGHNSVNFVVAGQRVERGDILAEVGSTGLSQGPHVHFELLHHGKNCDPASLLRPGIRHRNGRRTSIPPTTWTRPNDRPASIRCYPRRHHPGTPWVINENPEEGNPADVMEAAPETSATEAAEPGAAPEPDPPTRPAL